MIKNFRFLTKCFGLIGAIALTFGIVSFKNVNALVLPKQMSESDSEDFSDFAESISNGAKIGTYTNFDYVNFPYKNLFNNFVPTFAEYQSVYYYSSNNKSSFQFPIDNNDYYIFIHNNSNVNLTYSIDSYSTDSGISVYYNGVFMELGNEITYQTLNGTILSNSYLFIDLSWDTSFKYFLDTYGLRYGSLYDVYSLYCNFTLNTDSLVNGDISFSYYPKDLLANLSGTIGTDLYANGYSDGYNTGYTQGQNDIIVTDYQGDSYNQIYQRGYDEGERDTISNNYQNKTYNEIYQSGVNNGYTQGQNSVNNGGALVNMLFTGIYTIVIEDLNAILTPTVFGVPILNILLSILGIVLIMALIKKFK